MIVNEAILNPKKTINFLNKKKLIKNQYLKTAEYLSKIFIDKYSLQNSNLDAFRHLVKIFLYYLKYKVEKIILTKKYNKGDFINLEFKVYPSFVNISDNQKNSFDNIKTISIDKFFLDNYKYIIV
tara:strand:- start:52 stop:426 length:375 start_codon:yes stop_codon:yes gene_type:complete